METNEGAIAALALRQSKDISDSMLRAILSKHGSLIGLLDKAFEELVQLGFDLKSAQAISELDTKAAERELKSLQKADISLLAFDDASYPQYLKEIYDPPALLYAMGDTNCLNDFCIAMVGARKASRMGEDMAKKLARELANAGVTVVSGFAYGIDICSHVAAAEAGGSTVAVLGSGLKHIYPQTHKKYIDSICKKGCLITEFPLDEGPASYNFPRRNRIISGMSRGIVVVEASTKSGSLITARTALEQSRDVFAVPTSPLFANNATNDLIRNGAIITECGNDILQEYAYMGGSSEGTTESSFTDEPDKEQIYKAVSIEPLNADELTEQLKMSYAKVAVLLMEMELDGSVEKGFDGRYSRG